MSIFQKCIYCQEHEVCQNLDCVYYGVPFTSQEEFLDCSNDHQNANLIDEFCDKIGIASDPKIFSVYKQLLQYNKKRSRVILTLASIYFTASMQFYLPIHRLVRFSDSVSKKKKENATTLHGKFIQIWVRAGLDPPLESHIFIVDFVINHKRKYFPPKISKVILQIMDKINICVENMQLTEFKLPVLTCLAFYLFKSKESDEADICELLGIPKSNMKKYLSIILECEDIIYELKSLDVRIDLYPSFFSCQQ